MAKVIVEVELDTEDLAKGLVQVQKKSEKTGKKIAKSLKGKRLVGSFEKSLKSLGKKILVLGSAYAAAFGARKILAAASRQEDAVKRINTALTLSGSFTEAASKDMQDYAASIQKATRFGDELVLEQLALAKAFGGTNEQAQQLVTAALDLSEATGISVESAVKNLGKTLGGLVGELGEVVPALKDFTQEQLKSGAALEFVNKRFGGAAAAQVNTFSGAIAQVGNSFGDLLEKLGFMIAKNPVFIAGIKAANERIIGLGKTIENFAASGGMKFLANSFILLGQVINTFVVLPIEATVNGLKVLFRIADAGMKAFTKNATSNAETTALRVEDAISKVGQGSFFGDLFTGFGAKTEDETAKSKSALEIFNEETKTIWDDLNLNTTNANAAMLEKIKLATDNLKKMFTGLGDAAAGAADKTVGSWNFAGVNFANIAGSMAKTAKALSASINKSIGVGVANSFAAFGAALATGQNALAAFGLAMLSTFGDILIQLGTQVAVAGALMSAVPILFGLQGPAAILAGLGMIVAGGALKAIAGAGGSGGAPSTGGGVASSSGAVAGSSDTEFGVSDTLERDTPDTTVTVNVEGNILDRRETGLELAEVINEAFGSNGVTLTQAGA